MADEIVPTVTQADAPPPADTPPTEAPPATDAAPTDAAPTDAAPIETPPPATITEASSETAPPESQPQQTPTPAPSEAPATTLPGAQAESAPQAPETLTVDLIIASARIKLDEISAEKSLPADVIDLFTSTLNAIDGLITPALGAEAVAHETAMTLAEIIGDPYDGFVPQDQIDAFKALPARVAALESQPKAVFTAAGVDGVKAAAARAILADARGKGAISGTTAEAIECLIDALIGAPQQDSQGPGQ